MVVVISVSSLSIVVVAGAWLIGFVVGIVIGVVVRIAIVARSVVIARAVIVARTIVVSTISAVVLCYYWVTYGLLIIKIII